MRDRRALLVILALGAVMLSLGGLTLRFIGAGLLLFASPPVLRPLLTDSRVRDRWRRFGPAIVFGIVFVALCGELLLGRPPATRDHGIHYFQTHLWVHDLMPQGRLNGWSDRLNHGYPFGDSYPVVGYVLMSALHLLSLGLVSLRASYAYGIVALWLGSALAVWWLAQCAARELSTVAPAQAEAEWRDDAPSTPDPAWHRWAGCVAGIAWLLDPGAARQGGWNYLLFHGVWPQQLSTALWVATIPLTLALWREPTPRRIGLLALATAGSVMAHPFGLLTCAFTAVMIPLVFLVGGGRTHFAPGAVRSHAIATALAAAACAGTVVVFLASADYMGRSPVPWLAWPELAAQLLTGEVFRAHRAVVGPLALLGVVAVVRAGSHAGRIAVIAVVGLSLLASEAAISGLRLDLLVAGFKNLQFPRYSLAIKPIWFALAGVGATTLARVLSERSGPLAQSGWRRLAGGAPARLSAGARLLACVALAPVLVGGVEGIRDAVPRPVGALNTLEGTHHGPHERALRTALQAEASAAEGRLRVAFLRRHMSGGTYPLWAIADADADLAMDSHIPSVNFIFRLDDRDPAALDALGTTHVIFDRPLPLDEGPLERRLELVGTYGDYRLARFGPVTPDREHRPARRGLVRAPTPVDAEGGEVEVEVTPEDLAAGDGKVRVELPVAPYRKWRAYGPDGRRLKISPRPMFGRSFTGMTVRVTQPGTVRFAYERPPEERATAWLAGAAWLLALAALASGRPIPWRARLRGSSRLRWIVGGVATLTVIAGAVAVPQIQAQKLARTWTSIIEAHSRKRSGPTPTFDRDLVVAGEVQVWTEHGDRCDGMLTKDARAGCSDRAQRPHVSSLYRRPYLYRCVAVTVPARGEAQLIVDGLADDASVFGVATRVTHGRGAKSLTMATSAPAARTLTMRRRREFVVGPEQRAPGAPFTLDLSNADEDPQTVCVALAAARAP